MKTTAYTGPNWHSYSDWEKTDKHEWSLRRINHQPLVTCQIGDQAIVNVVHENLPPDVDKVDDVWRFSFGRLNTPSRSVVTQIPRFHGTDKMRHFRRLAKPLAHTTHTTVLIW